MRDKDINDYLRKRIADAQKIGKHANNERILLAYREKYNTREKREAKQAEMIAQWLEREGVK